MRQRLIERLRRHRSLALFAVVGASGVVVNMAVYLAALATLDAADVDSANRATVFLAATLGWLVSVATNFALNDRITFQSAGRRYETRIGGRLLRYYSSASVAYAVQAAVLWGLLAVFDQITPPAADDGGWQSLLTWALRYRRAVANLIGIAIATIANYLLARHWVFRATDAAS